MHIVVTSPRVAPGLLTSQAWDVLRQAETVLAPDLSDPTVVAVAAAGIAVQQSPASPTLAPGVVWLAPAGDAAWAAGVASELMNGKPDEQPGEAIEVIFGSYDLPGSQLLDLVDVMDRLRRECPWTRGQTHGSLGHYLLEEAHETLEALDSRDSEHLREELGDLLMQIVFHARIAEETDGWSIDEVAEGITAKLIYRNPHVFGDATVDGAEEVDANWQRLKAAEKGRASPLDGIPATLPALAYADKVLGRLGDAAAGAEGNDIGSRLLALVHEARAEGVDAEEALRQTVRRLTAD